jgi:hypothetical protein
LTTVTPDRPRTDALRLFDDVPAPAPARHLARSGLQGLDVPAGGRLTLGQRLDRVWEGLLAGGVAACPVCRGLIEGGAPGAECPGCGSRIE